MFSPSLASPEILDMSRPQLGEPFNRSKQDYHKTPNGTLPPPPFRVSSACPAKPSEQVKKMGLIEAIAQKAALSGDVYLDEIGRTWFQLAAGGVASSIAVTNPSRRGPVGSDQKRTPLTPTICGKSAWVVLYKGSSAVTPWTPRS